jgi:arylsulfatase
MRIGEGLCVGYDIGDAVSADYAGRFPFTGGTIINVLYDVADDVYISLERREGRRVRREPEGRRTR